MRKYKLITTISIIILVLLAGTFFLSQDTPLAPPQATVDRAELSNATSINETETTASASNSTAVSEADNPPPQENDSATAVTENIETQSKEITSEEAIPTEVIPVTAYESEATPPPADENLTCTLSVRCDTVLNNMNRLDKEKLSIVPSDGIIFPEHTITFFEGESAFDVTLREMKNNGIHFEFVNTPIYNNAYIEGIGNLYELDCGELSGWMYKINGIFPNYGSSKHILKTGDKIEWVYTCDLGNDIGGRNNLSKE